MTHNAISRLVRLVSRSHGRPGDTYRARELARRGARPEAQQVAAAALFAAKAVVATSVSEDVSANGSKAMLLAQEIELAFVVGPLSASGVHNRMLADYPIGFLASPSLGLEPVWSQSRRLASTRSWV